MHCGAVRAAEGYPPTPVVARRPGGVKDTGATGEVDGGAIHRCHSAWSVCRWIVANINKRRRPQLLGSRRRRDAEHANPVGAHHNMTETPCGP